MGVVQFNMRASNWHHNQSGLRGLPADAVRVAYGLILVLSLAVLPACALVKGKEAPRETFDLSAPKSIAGLNVGGGSQILVKVPNALKTIDNDRLIIKPSPSVITYLAGAQWADTIPKLVQARLVETFENTGATRATAIPGDGLVIDYQLVSDIRRFEISGGTAVIEMSVKLLVDRTGLVRETRIFTASAPANGSDNDAYVAAFDAAFDQLATSIARWVIGST